MHGLIQTQTFDVRKVDDAALHAGHNLRQDGGFKGHVGGTGLNADLGQKISQFKAIPWHDHRPSLNTAEPVDAFLNGHIPDQVLQRIGAGIVDQTVHRHLPRIGLHVACIGGWIGLASAEFIEVVVGADFFERVGLQRFLRVHRTAQRAGPRHTSQNRAAVHPQGFRGHVITGEGVCPAVGH